MDGNDDFLSSVQIGAVRWDTLSEIIPYMKRYGEPVLIDSNEDPPPSLEGASVVYVLVELSTNHVR